MDFPTDEDRIKYEVVVKKFSELCLGETNETYECFIFNSRQKSDEESIDKYVTTLRRLAQTCTFVPVCTTLSFVLKRSFYRTNII